MVIWGMGSEYQDAVLPEKKGMHAKLLTSFQDAILHIMDMSYRSIRAVDQVTTVSQLLDANIPLQHKIIDSARFLKEYPHGLHEKWRLRADKISLGARRGEEGRRVRKFAEDGVPKIGELLLRSVALGV